MKAFDTRRAFARHSMTSILGISLRAPIMFAGHLAGIQREAEVLALPQNVDGYSSFYPNDGVTYGSTSYFMNDYDKVDGPNPVG